MCSLQSVECRLLRQQIFEINNTRISARPMLSDTIFEYWRSANSGDGLIFIGSIYTTCIRSQFGCSTDANVKACESRWLIAKDTYYMIISVHQIATDSFNSHVPHIKNVLRTAVACIRWWMNALTHIFSNYILLVFLCIVISRISTVVVVVIAGGGFFSFSSRQFSSLVSAMADLVDLFLVWPWTTCVRLCSFINEQWYNRHYVYLLHLAIALLRSVQSYLAIYKTPTKHTSIRLLAHAGGIFPHSAQNLSCTDRRQLGSDSRWWWNERFKNIMSIA